MLDTLGNSPVADCNVPIVALSQDANRYFATGAIATSLPEPGWNMDRPSSRLQWLYPFQTLALGQRIFVAERVGLAEAAVRAVRAYSRHAQKKLNTSRGWFNYEWRNVHGVRGVVIGRIA